MRHWEAKINIVDVYLYYVTKPLTALKICFEATGVNLSTRRARV